LNLRYFNFLTNVIILLRVFQEEDAHYFKVASVNGSWVRVALAKSLEELVDSVQRKRRDEHGALTDLLAGDTVRDVWDRWRVF